MLAQRVNHKSPSLRVVTLNTPKMRSLPRRVTLEEKLYEQGRQTVSSKDPVKRSAMKIIPGKFTLFYCKLQKLIYFSRSSADRDAALPRVVVPNNTAPSNSTTLGGTTLQTSTAPSSGRLRNLGRIKSIVLVFYSREVPFTRGS